MTAVHAKSNATDNCIATNPAIKVDILIVGGGIVGASCAVMLASQQACADLNIMLVDANGAVAPVHTVEQFDSRVVALSQQSKGILATAGAWQGIVDRRCCPYQSMHVWDADGTGNISFYADDIHQDELGYICENRVVLAALYDALHTHDRIKIHAASVESQREIEHGRELVLSDSTIVHCGLVIAADGAKSKMRTLAGLETKEWDYRHTAIVSTVKTQQSHQFCAWQRFSCDGPLAFLPLTNSGTDSNTASIVWSLCTKRAEAMMQMSDDEFKRALTREFESRLGDVVDIDKRVAIPLRQRHAKQYIQRGLALLGDAAHTIHPLAGQGVNLGLYDVEALVAEIVRACKRSVPINEMATLRRFQRARRPHNLTAMLAMESLKRLFGSDNLALRYLRNTGLNTVDKHYFVKKWFAKAAAGQLANG